MRRLATVVAFALLVTQSTISGASCEANGSSLKLGPETVLSGMGIFVTKIDAVIYKLGKPDHVTLFYGQEPPVPSGGVYEWQTKNWRLKVLVMEDSTISQVDVWGTNSSNGVGSTRRGLRLGDTVKDARRIYGLRPYFGTSIPIDGGPFASRSFPEPSLQVDFDNNGRICHLGVKSACCEY